MGPKEKKICSMLTSGDPDLQCAAAKVLGELRPRDAGVIRALGSVLADSRESVRLYALGALKNIRSKSALKYVIPRLSAEDLERRAAVAAITAVGSTALGELKKELPGLSPFGRRAAADIIISIGTETSFAALLDALSLGDFDLCRHVCDLFRDRVPAFSKSRKDLVFRRISRYLNSRKTRKNEVATMAGLRLLGYVGHARSLDMLIPYLDEAYSPSVRRHALLAVSALLPVRKPKPDFVHALLKLLSDRAHPDLMETSMRILNGLNIPASLSDEMIKLLYNRHSAVRKLAVRALESFGTIKATRALLECLGRTDWELTSETMSALRKIKHTPDVILAEVEKTDDKERARRLANVLRGGKFEVSPNILNNLSSKLLDSIEHGNDKLDIYFALLSSLSEQHLAATLLHHAEELKNRKEFHETERTLRMLTQLGPPPAEVKYQLGVIRLKLSSKSPSPTERAADPALALLASLIRIPKFELARKLESEVRVLEPADYYYLGRHFAESQGDEKAFGTHILKFLIRFAPNSDEALKLQGKKPKAKEPAAMATAKKATAKKAPSAKATARKPAAKKTAKKEAVKKSRE
jgi:HEAT repeat protein